MPISRTYACDECGGRFKFLHMTRDEPPPSSCELCGKNWDEEPEPELAAPALGGSALAKSVDQVYAQAEATRYDSDGNFVSKGVTDWNSGLQAGEVAARPIHNAVTEYAEAAGHSVWGGANASQYVAAAKAGGPVSNPALAAISGRRGR